jgi:hypothetical protein
VTANPLSKTVAKNVSLNTTVVDDYFFRAPLLIYEEGIWEIPVDGWTSGEAWLESLSTACAERPAKALVLPLELKTEARPLSELFGIELLNWLRWCAPDPIRWLPVIAVSWQSLTSVLRQKPNLLLVCPGTQFQEIPDLLAQDRRMLQLDIAAARQDKLVRCDESTLRRYTMGTAVEAAQVTYHDLANDHYAAYRLWLGYLHALEQSLVQPHLDLEMQRALQTELKRAHAAPVRSIAEIERKQHTPSFQHFKLVRSVADIPAYPHMEGAEAIFRQHILNGLSSKVRVLLVDDEFDKGVADTLLQVLFRQTTFTAQSSGQAIYKRDLNDAPKARLVCVKTAEAARNWLRYWGELPFSDEAREAMSHGLSSEVCAHHAESGSFRNWLHETYLILGGSEGTFEEGLQRYAREEIDVAEADTCFREAAGTLLCKLDDPEASPKRMTTVMILDLRLEKGAVPKLYDAGYFSSTALRREVKRAQPKLPILMFTASRQAMNYASIMAEATNIDGWLCKEAPDSPEDLENSTNSLLYLISQAHMFGGMSEWWHKDLGWAPEDEGEYSRFFTSPQAESSLEHVGKEATQILQLVHQDRFSKLPPFAALLGKLTPPLFQTRHHKTESLLVARRLIVGTLLMTSAPNDQSLVWDAAEFVRRLRGDKYIEPLLKKGNVYVSKFGNQREFWFPSLAPDRILLSLLDDELLWLQSLDWRKLAPGNASLIQRKIKSTLDALKATAGLQ